MLTVGDGAIVCGWQAPSICPQPALPPRDGDVDESLRAVEEDPDTEMFSLGFTGLFTLITLPLFSFTDCTLGGGPLC